MILKATKAALSFAPALFLAFFSWISSDFNRLRKMPEAQNFYEVAKGKGIGGIARDLEEKGFLQRRLPFLLGYQLFYHPRSLKAGEYAFPSLLTTKIILNDLTRGKIYLHPLTIPEGLTSKEIAQFLQPLSADTLENFQQAFADTSLITFWNGEANNLEGYLFPETYHFPRGVTSEDVVKAMVSQFRTVFHDGWKARANALRMSIRKVVILASLIEKETSLPEERDLVSSVFHNRLKIGMKLDCDPTIIYALKQEDKFEGRLRSKDLRLDSPYNTYLYPGLPPGPICNPGRESLRAALYPADTDYLYFVSKNDGSHHFSRRFEDHQAAVRKFQKRK